MKTVKNTRLDLGNDCWEPLESTIPQEVPSLCGWFGGLGMRRQASVRHRHKGQAKWTTGAQTRKRRPVREEKCQGSRGGWGVEGLGQYAFRCVEEVHSPTGQIIARQSYSAQPVAPGVVQGMYGWREATYS